ncbi:MAG: hypothetical protein QF898_04035 [SAR202 cluster bacterium]|nr:hypothetical protein [SAR202 cluster bacterium]MDP6513568.1 hypothetical protein [SAR202 cluster bacterium]MDP6714728.1 hypothetical protein [SAR202 cluster bacterium]
MGRSNWYYDHPPTCNCAQCTEKRAPAKKPKGTLSTILDKIKAIFTGR